MPQRGTRGWGGDGEKQWQPRDVGSKGLTKIVLRNGRGADQALPRDTPAQLKISRASFFAMSFLLSLCRAGGTNGGAKPNSRRDTNGR